MIVAWQVTSQLEAEKAALLARKREQQAERRHTQDNLDRILQENRRKVQNLDQTWFPVMLVQWTSQVLQNVCSLLAIRQALDIQASVPCGRTKRLEEVSNRLCSKGCLFSSAFCQQVEEAQQKAAEERRQREENRYHKYWPGISVCHSKQRVSSFIS